MHSRVLILFLLLLGCHSAAQAQQETLASQTHKQQLRSQYLTNDTAQAIINLYGRRQAGGATWIVTSALAAARLATSGGSTTTINGAVTRETAPSGAAFLVAVPFVGYGVGKLVHYSNGKLDQVLAAYAAGQPLPRSLRRKLKPRFFSQPIIPYKVVSTNAAN